MVLVHDAGRLLNKHRGLPERSLSGGLSFSIDSARARVGRPLTTVSVAGVARRTTRRAVVGGAVVGETAVKTHCARVFVNGSVSAAQL